jgi:tRNA 2-thiouridine synthesizing protein A
MAEILDYRGMRCPQPVLKAAMKIQTLPPGTVVEIQADCPEFPHQVKEWCEKSGRVLISVVDHGAYKTATVKS